MEPPLPPKSAAPAAAGGNAGIAREQQAGRTRGWPGAISAPLLV